MDQQSITDQLLPVFAEVFEDDSIRITEATSQSDIENWDSLSHLHLIVAIEKQFKIRFTASEVEGFQNVGEIIKAIAAKS